MWKAIKQNFFDTAILVSLLLFHLVNNYIWLRLDKAYLQFDSHWHFLLSLKVFEQIEKLSFFSLFFKCGDLGSGWHGVFVGYITAPFYFIFGKTQDAGVMINSSIFLCILVFSTYAVGKRLFDRKVGLLAAFIVTMYPVMFNQLRVYMLDFPLAAMVMLGIYLLLLSDNFKNKKYSLLFGIVAGLGLLTKFNFIAFISGPLCITLYRAFTQRKKEKDTKQTLVNIAFLFIVILSIASFFYIVKFKDIFFRITTPWENRTSGHMFLFYLDSLFFYIRTLVNNTISFFFFVIFLIGFWIFAVKKKVKNKLLLLSPIIISLFFLIFIYRIGVSRHMDRYSMPILPLIAIISAVGILSIRYAKIKIFLIFFTIVFSITQFFAVSYGIYSIPQTLEVSIPNSIFGIKNRRFKSIALFNQNIDITPRLHNSSRPVLYSPYEKKIKEILSFLDDHEGEIEVSFIDCIPEVSEPMIYHVFVEKKPINIRWVLMMANEFYKDRQFPIYQLALKSNFVIVMEDEGRAGNFYIGDSVKENVTKAKAIFYQNIDKFELVKELGLSKNRKLLLYKNKLNFVEVRSEFLKLFFDRGRAKLYYKDIELTEGKGFSSTFSYQGKGYDSAEAVWQVEKISPHEILAVACWPGLSLKETWYIRLQDNHIDWQIDLEAAEKMEISHLQSGIYLKDEYKTWLSLFDEGSLPKLLPWQKEVQVKIDRPSCLIGLNSIQTKKGFLPAVIIHAAQKQLLNKTSIFLTRNTETGFPSLYMSNHNIKSKLCLVKGNHTLFKGEVFLSDKGREINDYIKKQKKQLFITRNELKLFFDRGWAKLYYKDIELTKGKGLSSTFFYQGKGYDSAEAVWQVEKISPHEILAVACWPGLSLKETWYIRLQDNHIDWQIDLEAAEKMEIKRRRVNLMLSGVYKKWRSLYGEGKFRKGKHWQGVVLKDLANKCISVANQKNMPGVIFDFTLSPSYIPAINYKNNVRALRSSTAEMENNSALPGNCNSFSAKLIITPSEAIAGVHFKELKRKEKLKKEALRLSLEIQRGPLKLFFDRGQGRIYWQDKELTKGFGLYTSLFSSGCWYDSQNVIWETKKISDNKIIARGEWIGLPISQLWQIELKKDNIIYWQIKMKVYENVNIDKEQTNIMLSEDYRDWAAADITKGKFPRNFNYQHWNNLYQRNIEQGSLSVKGINSKGRYFPSVMLDLSSMGKDYIAAIKNTNIIFRGRVLSCYKVNKNREVEFAPGEYEYFKGEIKINKGF